MTGFTLAITNQKGGVGKTTTALNLSAALAHLKKRVLLVDLDPQGNATTGCGIDKNRTTTTLNEVLKSQDEAILEHALLGTAGGLDLLPSNSHLTESEIDLLSSPEHPSLLKQRLKGVRARYDFIVIDCPPALNSLTFNGLVAAEAALIPMQCEYYALEGLSSIVQTIEEIQQHFNPPLQLHGLVRTMWDPRNRLSLAITEQLLEHFPDALYETAIPRNVRLAEAPSHGQSIFEYAPLSTGAKAYLNLGREFLRRIAPTAAPTRKG